MGARLARRDPWDRPVARGSDDGSEAMVYADRARRLGLPFVAVVHLPRGSIADLAAIREGTFAKAPGEGPAFIAPAESAMDVTAGWLVRYPAVRPRLSVATPSAIRAALIEASGARLIASAVGRLSSLYPDLSAARRITVGQVAAGLLLVAAIGAALYLDWAVTLASISLVGALFFFGVTVLRFVAAAFTARRTLADESVPDVEAEGLPVYSILVPLLDEAHIVPDLVAALDRIEWPRDRLDIKLIVEAPDRATTEAAQAAVTGPPYEVIVVPDAAPRTKPKALAFALPLSRGDYITVYDAEDRPHPRQLLEAFSVFVRSPPELACLQSPIVVDNSNAGWFARQFAIEYSTLFDGLLPTLAAHGMPLPLGGTSNHFRREALETVGGWDPFNVTEDADLGLRLARFGYRSATIDLPTEEEAPAALNPWLNQRTRWFKGWMQTWLVHMRHPVRLAREIGWRGLLGFSLTGTGLIISAIIHPIWLLTLVAVFTYPLGLWGDGSILASSVIGLNLFNLGAAHWAMIALARRSLTLRGRRRETRALIGLVPYWLLMSVASYRALWELVASPHQWRKTPHRGRRRRPRSL
jgi:cellulose synthase/poly-beta-1,6-N-acetylglucosamine synthase-like glycosyltransferase